MMGRCKIIPVLLLVFYALCTVCPERLLPLLALQRAAASEAHDCHNRDRQKPEFDCRTVLSEFLPSPEAKLSHILAVHVLLLPQHALSLAFGPALPIRTTHFSTAGPSLKINLRI
jgi:hypothetical protein